MCVWSTKEQGRTYVCGTCRHNCVYYPLTHFHLLSFFTHNPPPVSSQEECCLSCWAPPGVWVLGVCAPWRASFVLWRPAAQPLCSAGFPVWSCRAAMLSNRHAFAFSGPIKLSVDVPVQVRYNTHSLISWVNLVELYTENNDCNSLCKL